MHYMHYILHFTCKLIIGIAVLNVLNCSELQNVTMGAPLGGGAHAFLMFSNGGTVARDVLPKCNHRGYIGKRGYHHVNGNQSHGDRNGTNKCKTNNENGSGSNTNSTFN